jgi:hypothetical protein
MFNWWVGHIQGNAIIHQHIRPPPSIGICLLLID